MALRGSRALRPDLAVLTVRSLGSTTAAMAVATALVGLLGTQGAHAGSVSARLADSDLPAWESRYSERYPGCVSMPLWPLGEEPVALVTRTPEGTVDRVPLGGVQLDGADSRANAIGACR